MISATGTSKTLQRGIGTPPIEAPSPNDGIALKAPSAEIFDLHAPVAEMSDRANLLISLIGLAAAEFCTIAAIAYVTGLTYFSVILGRSFPRQDYITSAFLLAGLVLLVSLGFRHYAKLQNQALHQFLWNGAGAVALAFSFFLSILFLLKMTDDYSRATFFFQFMAVVAADLGLRAIGHTHIQSAISAGRLKARRTIVIGNPKQHSEIAQRLSDAGVQTIRLLPFPVKQATSVGSTGTDIDHGQLHRMIEICRKLRPDDILILSDPADLVRSARLADVLSELPVSLHMIPVGAESSLVTFRLGELGGVVTIQLLHLPLSMLDRAVKRAFDIAAALVGILMFSPLLLLVALAIKLDSRGPIFFRQTRHGYNNDAIRVFKFRSMTATEDGTAFTQATKNDPRVTRVGRLMRKTNIDELPQLLNVLLGEMSLVGPRPHPVALNEMFAKDISPLSRRHNVKPGITGWAQVNGYRGETDTLDKMRRRFEHDLYYIDNWSFLLDLKIILMTLFSKSAYMNAF
jgi:Undecaprenyl-phosphate glucose phosphotransferase